MGRLQTSPGRTRAGRYTAEAIRPRRQADADEMLLDVISWSVPCQMKGIKGQPITKHVTNVPNLTSTFWRSMLTTPERRCLVPFTHFAEPKPAMPVILHPEDYAGWLEGCYGDVCALDAIPIASDERA
jgi:putative SOS response-associated peptidase YedK